MNQIERIPGALPTSPNGEVARPGESQSGVRPASALQSPGIASDRSAVVEIDPIKAIADVINELPPLVARPGLADQLLEYVRPRIVHPEALTPPLLIPLLSAAAEHVGRAAGGADDIASLGATALGQELRRHRDLAERRATLLGAGTPEG